VGGEGAAGITSDAVQDLVCSSGPHEGRWGVVVDINMVADGGFEFLDAAEGHAADASVGEFCEPALDETEPLTLGGREVDMKPGPLGEQLGRRRATV
jgi:hypothetical protein